MLRGWRVDLSASDWSGVAKLAERKRARHESIWRRMLTRDCRQRRMMRVAGFLPETDGGTRLTGKVETGETGRARCSGRLEAAGFYEMVQVG